MPKKKAFILLSSLILIVGSLLYFSPSIVAQDPAAEEHGTSDNHSATTEDEAGHGEEAAEHDGDATGHADEGDDTGEHGSAAGGHAKKGHGGGHGPLPVPLWSVIPFILMLLSIAILPLTCEHWWEDNKNRAKIAFPLGLAVAAYLYMTYGGEGFTAIEHSMVEYLQFIILLGSLYIISGGIVLRGDLKATPKVNTIFLLIGGLIASFVGTTGASMLLIRPVLKTNSERKHVIHTVVFFIFIVSNIGGCLTPLGDPPLFLGFLKGVDFTWTFTLWAPWLVANSALLAIYYVWDSIAYKKEEKKDIVSDDTHIEPLRLAGGINFLFLAGVIVAVASSSVMNEWFHATFFDGSLGENIWFKGGSPFREIIMIIMVILSTMVTPKALKEENKFSMAPINEVAILFIGIFLTMIPAIHMLKANGSQLGVDNPIKFFWVTGGLSSFLDNAPTYVVFFETAKAMASDLGQYGELVAGVPAEILTAISLGAVFMGANSYIGNGPNFMVKAVAEESGLKMPSFFGYMKYSMAVLIPLFVVITLIFMVF